LLDADYDRRLHAAQFVTEVQGGSDVGLNEVRAVPDPAAPGGWRLFGEKWFCSVADAGLFVVSARPEGAPDGTRGLGLFLVPRELEGRPNGFALRRLKIKLGTRSMPTGEIEFDGAAAEPIGDIGDGFRNLVGIVLDTSRFHNAVAACGLMRRAFSDARAYARHRVAFGHPIIDYPSVQEILARMKLRSRAALATTFRLLDQTDRADIGRGDDDLRAARRIGVMVNKYWTAIQATRVARDGIEILGGNGTIEDFSVLPRLYRDAIVIESWEGTHNTLCAQILRDFRARDLHRPWLDQIAREVDEVRSAGVGDLGELAASLLDDLRHRIDRLVDAEEITAAAWIRGVVDRMAVLTDWVSLATQAAWETRRDLDTGTADMLELYRRLELDSRDRMDDDDRMALETRIVR
jgi:alkylation response protein AidB-like acyl-CoA dehydrogenase